MIQRVLTIFFLSLLMTYPVKHMAAPLPAKDVFSVEAQRINPNMVQLNWRIQPGYFLYQSRIHVTPRHSDIFDLGVFKFPAAVIKKSKQGQPYKIYRKSLILNIPILGVAAGEQVLTVRYQGCSDAGYCYPPQVKRFVVSIDQEHAVSALTPLLLPASTTSTDVQTNQFSLLFKQQSIWLVMLSFFGFGILLSFTPCVLPMIPVLSSIVLKNKAQLSSKQAFLLSLSYVLGLSLTYALLGAGFAYMGSNLQLLFQTPWAIGGLSFLFILLALSMFDLFELRLPSRLQDFLSSVFQRQRKGSYGSALLMGSLSVLILSPCVTPPLVGVFLYVAETGRVMLGMMALFFLGLGSGLPLLILSVSATHYLPKTGQWMIWVKRFFGVLLLLVALHLLSGLFHANNDSQKQMTTVNTVTGLNQMLKQHQGQPLVLDYDAQWCTACRVMEKTTFKDQRVLALLKQIRMIKVDVTHPDSALLQAFKVMGPPTFIFIGSDGQEISSLRLVGEISAEEMSSHLRILLKTLKPAP